MVKPCIVFVRYYEYKVLAKLDEGLNYSENSEN